jgi:RNA polymerase sigma factor (sigma-70 family)
MDTQDRLADDFEAHRAHLRAVAYRMLGSAAEAEDAVQEAWLRLSRADAASVDNLGGWLTTVVARICLDMLRSRKSRREEPLEGAPAAHHASDPEQEAVLSDSVGLALLIVLDTLAPAERLAFVLHDMFDVPFDEIAPIVDRSEAAARQLASRARRRVQGADPDAAPDPVADAERRRAVVDAFLAASRGGDFEALLTVLDPDVVVRADRIAVAAGADPETRGALAVAGMFNGRAEGARPALLDGMVGAAFSVNGKPRMVFHFVIVDGRVAEIDITAEPRFVRATEVQYL